MLNTRPWVIKRGRREREGERVSVLAVVACLVYSQRLVYSQYLVLRLGVLSIHAHQADYINFGSPP